MDSSDHSEIISQFMSITGCNHESASTFLQESNWQIEVALGSFFEANQPENSTVETNSNHHLSSQTIDAAKSSSSISSNSPSTKKNPAPKKFASLGDYKNSAADDDDSENNRYFAGGGSGGRSGQLIEGEKPDNLITSMFERAKENGAQRADAPSEPKPGSFFQGQGVRLGDSSQPSKDSSVPNPTPATSSRPPAALAAPVTRILTFWREGFSIDDGPLRRYDDPQNQELLGDVNRGIAPRELHSSADGLRGECHVNLVDKRDQDFVPPKIVTKPFAGDGFKLGNAVPSVISTPSHQPQPSPSPAPSFEIPIDASQPTTTLQIRLVDGTRFTSTFNQTHTVGDIRNLIQSKTPHVNFKLITTFPRKELNDEKQTISSAQLLNAVIVQQAS